MLANRIIALIAVVFFTVYSKASANPVFGYTHLLPSPFTLPAGKLVLGTDVALGLTDFFQVGTNILRDAYKTYNANARISLLEFDSFSLSPTFEWQTFNYRDISDSNPDLRVTSLMPGAVVAIELLPTVAWFIGGNLNFTNTTLVDSGVATSGYVRGVEAGSDISWAYNGIGKTKRGRTHVGNVLSGGASYDFSFKLFGVGISHHWPGFHLGVHYYPSATKFPVQPIVAGGAVIDI